MKTTFSSNCCAMFSLVVLVLISIAIAYNEQVSYLDNANKFYDSHQLETRSSRTKYCGPALVNALALVCHNIYNKRNKAQDYYEPDNVIQTDDTDSGPKYSLSLPKLASKDGFKYFHRNIRGVVDECCRKPCSLSTMVQYCGN